jgi:hypothetical protein
MDASEAAALAEARACVQDGRGADALLAVMAAHPAFPDVQLECLGGLMAGRLPLDAAVAPAAARLAATAVQTHLRHAAVVETGLSCIQACGRCDEFDTRECCCAAAVAVLGVYEDITHRNNEHAMFIVSNQFIPMDELREQRRVQLFMVQRAVQDMRTYTDSAAIQAGACVFLNAVLFSKAHRHLRVALPEVADVLVAALQRHATARDLYLHGLQLLDKITALGVADAQTPAGVEVMQLLIAAQRTFVADAVVVLLVFATLIRMFQPKRAGMTLAELALEPHHEGCALAVRCGAIEAAVGVMHAHGANAMLQYCACRLTNLLQQTTHDPAEVTARTGRAHAAGAVRCALAALDAHAGDPDVQVHAMRLLTLLAKSSRLRPSPGGAGAPVHAIMRALRVHAADTPLVLECMQLSGELTAAADDAANALAFIQAGAIPLYVTLMSDGLLTPERFLSVAYALSGLIRAPEHRRETVDLGLLELLVAAMRAHAAHDAVQLTCCTILRAYVKEPECNARMLECGALPCAQAALRAHGCGADLVRELEKGVRAKEAAADAAMAALLAEEEAEGAARRDAAARKPKAKSKAKSKGAKSGAGQTPAAKDAAGSSSQAGGAAEGAAAASAAAAGPPPAAAPEPAAPAAGGSAEAARRRRRAATKAARRAAAGSSGAGGSGAAEGQAGLASADAGSADDGDEEAALSTGAAAAADGGAAAAGSSSVAEAAATSSDAAPSPADAAEAGGADDGGAAGAGGGVAEPVDDAPASAELLESLFPWMRMHPSAGGAGPSAAAAPPPPPPVLPPLPLQHAAPPALPHARMAAAAAAPSAAVPAQAGGALAFALAPPPAAAAAASAGAAPAAKAEERPMCSICLDAPPCVLLLPCRHMPLCGDSHCFSMLGAPPLCPLCRVGIADTISVFI